MHLFFTTVCLMFGNLVCGTHAPLDTVHTWLLYSSSHLLFRARLRKDHIVWNVARKAWTQLWASFINLVDFECHTKIISFIYTDYVMCSVFISLRKCTLSPHILNIPTNFVVWKIATSLLNLIWEFIALMGKYFWASGSFRLVGTWFKGPCITVIGLCSDCWVYNS